MRGQLTPGPAALDCIGHETWNHSCKAEDKSTTLNPLQILAHPPLNWSPPAIVPSKGVRVVVANNSYLGCLASFRQSYLDTVPIHLSDPCIIIG